nr:ATP-binding protein [Actinokineospora cianjurensis]
MRAVLAEQCEQAALDYKQPLDLGERGELIEFAKDVAAMRSNPTGGYIVVGADDRGDVVAGLTPGLAAHFDEATLRPKLGKFLTSPEIHAACHEIDGHTVALVYVAPAPNGWCVIHTTGEYTDTKGRDKTVFRAGDVFVRHGTSSERWNDTDVDRLLTQAITQRKDAWRRELASDLAAQATTGATLRNLTNLPAASLSWDIDAATFEDLVTELLRRDDDVALGRLLSRAGNDVAGLLDTDPDELRRLLDRISTIAALAIDHDRTRWVDRSVTTLLSAYELGFDNESSPRDGAAVVWLWLDIITQVYALGALAVRRSAWTTVRLLADRRPDAEPFNHYGSWLRHAVTTAARASIFDNEATAGLLARAHNIIRANPALHPDRPAEQPAILNSLCQFDVYGALVVIGARGTIDSANFYTNFARYYSARSAPAFETIVSDPAVRNILFVGDDQLLADAIREIASLASHEGWKFNGFTGLDSPAVAAFIAAHVTPDRG